ncbi:MAG: hypothetical protein PQJ60_08630, partial [Spirochaetales bacterium]|nr:hypothetical protein [Spirochaetales bacterium]
MKRRLSVTVFLFLAFSLGALYAQENLTRDVLLSERWSNDEFSFDFSPVGTVVSYYTAGDREGTLRGKWRRSNEGVTLRNLNLEGDYPEDFIENGSMVLNYRYDENDPKASQRLQAGEEGQLRVWNKASFTAEERALSLEDPYREEAI